MKLVEIIPHLENGEKIRKQYWEKDKYIYIAKCGIIVDQLGNNRPEALDLRDVWELYVEE